MKYQFIILFLISLVTVVLTMKPFVGLARQKGLTDKPDGRKVHSSPIPIVGGLVIFFGIIVSLCFYKTTVITMPLFPVVGAMTIMLYVGIMDDLMNVEPWLRMFVEVVTALMLIFGLRCYITDFQGMWGIESLPLWLGVVLSVITFVGVVNAINMIDGIDGLSASFSIFVLGCLGLFCFMGGVYSFAALSAVTIGGLLPFLFCNLFGKETKTFIGDNGTMMLGAAIASQIFVILSDNFTLLPRFSCLDFSRIAFVLAVLSVPVADTLRVMAVRICRGKSPVRPDNNHFHHILLRSGLSQSKIIVVEIGINALPLAVMLAIWLCGASLAWQLYSVILTAAIFNWLLAAVLNHRYSKRNA